LVKLSRLQLQRLLFLLSGARFLELFKNKWLH
jgi:hypothetical protein